MGLAPLFVSRYRGLPFRVAGFLGTGCSDYGDFLLDPERKEAALGALVSHLSAGSDWDVLDLQQVPKESTAPLSEALSTTFQVTRLPQDECYSMALPGSYEDILGPLTKKFRWNVEYYRRRLDRDFQMRFRRSERPEEAADDIATFFRLHQKRFVSKRKLGRFISPRFVRFHSEVALEMLNSNKLGLFFLELDGVPVAALYGFRHGGIFHYYLSGFEPDWGKMSVSTVLLSMVIERCIDEGMTKFDFLRGAEPYKTKWGAVGSENSRLVVGRIGQPEGVVNRLIKVENDLVMRAKSLST